MDKTVLLVALGLWFAVYVWALWYTRWSKVEEGLMVAKRKLKPRVADRVLMYRARKELPVRTDRGRIQKGEMVTVDKAEAIATALGAKLSELFEEA